MNLDGTFNVYKGMNKELEGTESEVDKSEDVKYGNFGIKGKPDFGLLKELQKDGFRKLAPILREFEVAKETYAYSSNSVLVVLYANRETNYHEVNIIPKEKSLEDSSIINNTKSLLEKILGFELTDPTIPSHNLIEEVGKN